MSFDYDYSEKQLEQFINNNVVGVSFPQKAKALLLSLVNGSDHVEHIRDWINDYAKEGGDDE